MSRAAYQPAAANGNASAGLFLQRKCACGRTTSPLAKECPQCQQARRFGPPAALLAPSRAPPLTSQRTSSASDPHEVAADRAAEQVLQHRAPDARQPVTPPRLQRLGSGPMRDDLPPAVQRVLRAPGAPLEPATRAFFEPRFGHDLSRVRVHRDNEADAAARSVDARAFTYGQQIVFGAGEYAPHTPSGRQLMAHELAHTVQQGGAARLQRKGRGPGSCGLLSAATATLLGGAAHVQIQTRLATRGMAVEMPIPRASKAAGVTSRRCQPDDTPMGFADVVRIARPRVAISEIKPYWSAGVLARAEALHYRRRATQSKERLTGTGPCRRHPPGLDDFAFAALAGPFTSTSAFDLLKGAITGTEDFGPFSLDPTRTLRAKEVGQGAIGYWCVKRKTDKKKKKDSKKSTKKKTQAKTKKPKIKKPKVPKPQGSAGAGNVGIGISIFSANVGGANAGVGVSVGSTSASFGTAGAGISWFSDAAAAGAVGAGVSKDSMGAAAGAAGVGISEDSESVGVGVVGAGTAKGSSSAAAGTAGAGHSEDTQAAVAGAAGKGEIKDSSVAAAGATGSGKLSGASGVSAGSPKKPIDPSDVTGPDADKVPSGEESAEDDEAEGKGAEAKGAGTSEGKGTARAEDAGTGEAKSTGGEREGRSAGEAGASGATGKAGTGTATAPPATTGTDSRGKAGTSTSAPLGVLPILPFGASDVDREKAASEAAKVTKLLSGARAPQMQLLKHLADSDPSGQYMVPTSQWVEKLLNVTRDLTADDIEYIKSLDWRPGSLSEADMRKRIEKALENKNKPKGDGDKSRSEASSGNAAGSGGKGGGSKMKEGTAPSGEGGKSGAESGNFTRARPFTGEIEDGYIRDYQFVTSGNPITSGTKVGATPTMTLQWIGDDKKAYYCQLKYKVTAGPTEKTDDKNANIRWLYFTLTSTNSEIINLAPEGQKPFLIRPGREAWYRVQKP